MPSLGPIEILILLLLLGGGLLAIVFLALGGAALGRRRPARTTAATVEARLAELDDLCARGVISTEERSAGRARLLGG